MPGVGAFEELTALRREREHDAAVRRRARYREIAEAYVRGLGRRVERASRWTAPPRWRASSCRAWTRRWTPSWSGWDGRTCAGRRRSGQRQDRLRGLRRDLLGDRWERLAAAGAAKQRPLWGSTSTKNPDYPDTLYVDELIGPDTVNTMPDATIEAARERATRGAHRSTATWTAAHADIRASAQGRRGPGRHRPDQLVDEGVKAFAEAYESLIETLEEKAGGLRPRRAEARAQRSPPACWWPAAGNPRLRWTGSWTGSSTPWRCGDGRGACQRANGACA